MIAVDTSAIMAILLHERMADACDAALESEDALLISAATVAELLVVAGRRDVGEAAIQLIDRLGLEIVPVTAATARRVAEVYSRWGKGVHPAGLNFADCFAYEVAQHRNCRLLFVGDDFARTDIGAVLTA